MNPSFTFYSWALDLRSDLAPGTRNNRPRPSRTLLLVVLASLLVVVLLAYRTRGVSFRWDLFLATLEHVDWRWLAVSICLILLSNVGRALRWQVMLRPFGRPIGVWRLTSDTAIGLDRRGPARARGRSGPALSDRDSDRSAVLFAGGGVAAGTYARSAGSFYYFVAMPSYAFRGIAWRLGPKIQDALAGRRLLTRHRRGHLSCVLLLAFRDPARRAQKRILSALTFLPRTAAASCGPDAGRVLDRGGMHSRSSIAHATCWLHRARMGHYCGE